MSNEKYLAIDIGGTEIKWAEMDAQFQIYDRGHQKTEVYSSDELLNLIHQIVNSYPSIEGIGLSVPGTVKMHDKDGVVKGGGALQFLDGVRLGRLVEESCQMTAAVLNDGKCGVLGEYQAGALRGCRSGAVLALGTGVGGGGIIIDGKILDGCHSFAGEFSFMNTDMFKPFCIERAVGGLCGWHSLKYDVLKEMNQEDSPEIDGRLIFEWIEEGSEPARRGLSQYASRISALIL